MKSPMLTREALQKASLVRGTPDWSPTFLIAEEFLAAQDREALAKVVAYTLNPRPGFTDEDGVMHRGLTVADIKRARAVIDALLGDA